MKYYLFKLKFLTPVHFGDVAEGGNLAQVTLSFGADKLFSALINEAAFDGLDADGLIKQFTSGEATLSSLFPWYSGEETELFLPKPFVQGNVRPPKAKNFEDLKQAATEFKKMKKMTVVRASEIGKFIRSVRYGEKVVFQGRDFAAEDIAVRVNKRNLKPLPYYVGNYVFSENSGLYFILGVNKEEFVTDFCELVKMLGLTGIGGKRSSGYGKFELAEDVKELENGGGTDAKCLASMLADNTADIQMNLAPVCPCTGQEKAIADGYYKLKKISGFAELPIQENVRKKDSFYVLDEGSCFTCRLQGETKVMHVPGLEHPIYRYCKGMFVGVRADD